MVARLAVLALLFTIGFSLALDFIPPDDTSRHGVVSMSYPSGCRTNAECMRLGLPLLKPMRLRLRRPFAPRASGVPDFTGYIVARDAETNDFLGYLAPSFNDYGQIGSLVSTRTGALIVTYSAPNEVASQVNLITSNPPLAGYPNLCAVQGYSSGTKLATDSYNFLYMSLCADALSPGPPQNGDSAYTTETEQTAQIETAIWTILDSDQLTVTWVNPVGSTVSTPTTYLLYSKDDSEIVITGDVSALLDALGADFPTITLSFERLA